MEKKRLLILVLLLAMVGAWLAFFLIPRAGTGNADADADAPGRQADDVPGGPGRVPEKPPRPLSVENTVAEPPKYRVPLEDDRLTRKDDGTLIFNVPVDLARKELHRAGEDPYTDLQVIEQSVRHYRLVFQENPVAGSNDEFMAALTGNNPKKHVFFPPDHPAFNEIGELLDRWGTPYYFHALSEVDLEIFSAGPDREHATGDDLILTERDLDSIRAGETNPAPEE